MSIIDRLDYLSDHQEIKGRTYSTFKRKFVGSCDQGNGGVRRYVKITAHGPNTLGDIEFKLLAFNKDDVSDAVTIDTTGIIKQADLAQGSTFWLNIQQRGIKYDSLCVLYDQVGGVDKTDAMDEQYCPLSPMLFKEDEQPDTYTAVIVLDRTDNVAYDYNNSDKVYI